MDWLQCQVNSLGGGYDSINSPGKPCFGRLVTWDDCNCYDLNKVVDYIQESKHQLDNYERLVEYVK